MFGSAKPLASLSSGLLARKGHARPAMKPQGFAGFDAATSLEDLGWNDMGEAPERRPDPEPQPAPLPPVLVQREELEAAVAAPAVEPEPLPEAASHEQTTDPLPEVLVDADLAAQAVARIARDTRRAGRSAAFTLRLPADRHLRLRLASAVQLRSAQLIVTDALDRYLASLPQLDDLARRAATHAED